MSDIKLTGQLPKGSTNGLDPIVRNLIDEPDRFQVILAVVDCKKVETDTDSGEVVPTMRIRRIEAITGDDKATAHRLMRRATERRTGRVELAFDVEEGVAEAFENLDGQDR